MDQKFLKRYLKYSLPKLLKIAEREFNAFIRNRDSKNGFFRCISCRKIKRKSQLNAGHFWSVGNYGSVRFNENNVHGQCIYCNKHLHGNLIPYSENLIRKIGEESYKRLEVAARTIKKWDKIEVISIIYEYRKRNKESI